MLKACFILGTRIHKFILNLTFKSIFILNVRLEQRMSVSDSAPQLF